MNILRITFLTVFIICSIYLPITSDDSILSTPYWNCNTCPDTIINRVIQRKDGRTGKSYVEVYYQINQFRKPTTFWVKLYK